MGCRWKVLTGKKLQLHKIAHGKNALHTTHLATVFVQSLQTCNDDKAIAPSLYIAG